MIVESGLADEVRTLKLGMSGGQADVPSPASRRTSGANGPKLRNTETISQQNDKPPDPASPGGDRSQTSGREGAT
jgi:hypothetical protein